MTGVSSKVHCTLVLLHSESDLIICLKSSYKLKNTSAVSDVMNAALNALRKGKLLELKLLHVRVP